MTHDPMAAIRDKVEAGERLSFADGLYLEEHADLLELGRLANTVRDASTATALITTSTRT